MQKEAERIAKIVYNELPYVQKEFPECIGTALYEKIIAKDLSVFSDKLSNHIRVCCTSVEGLCYMIAMDMGGLRGHMKTRCLQFTKYMNAALYAYGFTPQTFGTKKIILQELELLIDGWEEWSR